MEAARPPAGTSAPVRQILESMRRIDARLEAEAAGAYRGAAEAQDGAHTLKATSRQAREPNPTRSHAPASRATARPKAVPRGIAQYNTSGVPAYTVDDVPATSVGRPGGLQYYYSPFQGNARLHSSNGAVVEAQGASAVLLDVRETSGDGGNEDSRMRAIKAVEAAAAAEAAREERELHQEQEVVASKQWNELQSDEEGIAPGRGDDAEIVWVQNFDGDGDPYYYNTVTHAMVWKAPPQFRPAEAIPPDPEPEPPVLSPAEFQPDNPAPLDEEDRSDDDDKPTDRSWTKYTDDEGDAYYYNQATGETTWTAPPGMRDHNDKSPSREVEVEVEIELDVADAGADMEVEPSPSSGVTPDIQTQVKHQMQQLVQQQAALVHASMQDKEVMSREVEAAADAAHEAAFAEAQRTVDSELAQAQQTLAAERAAAERRLAEERAASKEREAVLQQTIHLAEEELEKTAGAEALALRVQHELDLEVQLRADAERNASVLQTEQLAAQESAAQEREARLVAEHEATKAAAAAADATAVLLAEQKAAAARATQEQLDQEAELQLRSRVWIQLSDDNGSAFFYNTETGTTTSDVPEGGYRQANSEELASLQAAVLADELAQQKEVSAEAEMRAQMTLNAELKRAAQELEAVEAARRDAEQHAEVAKELADAEETQRLAAQQQVAASQEEKAVEAAAHAAAEQRLAATMERLDSAEISLQAAHAEAESKLAEQRLAAERAILAESSRVRDDADAIAEARVALEREEAAQHQHQLNEVAEREKELAVAHAKAEAEQAGVLKTTEAVQQAAKHGEELVAIERERTSQMEGQWRREEAARRAAESSYAQAEQTIVAIQEAARQSAKLDAMESQESLMQEQLARAKAEEDAVQEVVEQRRLAEEAVHKIEEHAALEVEQYRKLAEEATQYAEESAGRAAEAETALQQSTAEWAAGVAGTWVRTFDEEGDPYYYHPATGETTWDVPESFQEEALDPKVVLGKLEAAEARAEQAEAMVIETEVTAAEQATEAGTMVEQATAHAEAATEAAEEERQRREEAERESARARQAASMERALVDAALSRQAEAESRAMEAQRKAEEAELSLASVDSPAARAAAVAEAVAEAMEHEQEERRQRQNTAHRSSSWSVAPQVTPPEPSVLSHPMPRLQPEPNPALQPQPAIHAPEPEPESAYMQTTPADSYHHDSRHTSVVSPLVVYNSIETIHREVEHSATPDIASYDIPVRNAGYDVERRVTTYSSPGYSPVVATNAAHAQQLRESAAARAHREATAREQAEQKAAELASMLAAAEAMLQEKQRNVAVAAKQLAEDRDREEQEKQAREQVQAEEEALRELERQQQERIAVAAQAAADAKALVGERAVQLQAARDSQLSAEAEAAEATRQTLHVLGHAVAVEGAINRAGSTQVLHRVGSPPSPNLDRHERAERAEHDRAKRLQQEVSSAESAIQEAVSLEQAAQEAARQVKADVDAKNRLAEDSAEARKAAESAAAEERERLQRELDAHELAKSQLAQKEVEIQEYESAQKVKEQTRLLEEAMADADPTRPQGLSSEARTAREKALREMMELEQRARELEAMQSRQISELDAAQKELERTKQTADAAREEMQRARMEHDIQQEALQKVRDASARAADRIQQEREYTLRVTQKRDTAKTALVEAERRAWEQEADRFEEKLAHHAHGHGTMNILNSLVEAGEAVRVKAAEGLHAAADEVTATLGHPHTQQPTRGIDRPRRRSMLGVLQRYA